MSEVDSPTLKNTISITTKAKKNDKSVEISMKEFLDFVKTAYQVQDTVEGALIAGGKMEAVNWLKLKEVETLKAKSLLLDEKKDCPKNLKAISATVEGPNPIKQQLDNVLNEGLMDSVLPYIIPEVQQNLKSKNQFKIVQIEKLTSQSSLGKKKSNELNSSKAPQKINSEVEIHVCDELKNTKKDFYCNQKLLVEKMGYFADVTQGQKLDDMDISVHCDITIFDWLMQWVKKDVMDKGEGAEEEKHDPAPELTISNVVPILVSASFLQMEPLLTECLQFTHENLNEILLRTTTNLNCINDRILARLAAMYTNRDIELIKDKKDRIQSKLYTKLIQSLNETEPETIRGHWMSLAYLYRCQKCQQLVSPQLGQKMPCHAQNMRLLYDGSLVAQHSRDPSWNLNEFILKLFKQLKTWRKVYWSLYGQSHFLYCLVCKRYFPIAQIGWCRHHREHPQYFTLDATGNTLMLGNVKHSGNTATTLPIGRYACCGERAYRFELLHNPESGCQFREHQVCTKCIKDEEIFGLLELFRDLIEVKAPKLVFPDRLTRLVARDANNGTEGKLCGKEQHWWSGLEIVPPRPKLGLLTNFVNLKDECKFSNLISDSNEELIPIAENVMKKEGSDSDNNEMLSLSDLSPSLSCTTSSESTSTRHSVECNPLPSNKKKLTLKKHKQKLRENRLWQHDVSARTNQDKQRSFEESAVKQICKILKRKTLNSDNYVTRQVNPKMYNRNKIPIGGIWVRLEVEWREKCSPHTPKAKSVNSNNAKLRLNKK